MSDIDVLTVVDRTRFLTPQLAASFSLHDRLHDTDAEAFARVAPRVRAILASADSRVTQALMTQLPALEIIAVIGVGYDGIDVASARAQGVVVTHTPGVLDDDVADHALALMLAAARQLPAADRYVREGLWPDGPLPLGRKMSGARLGLVGMGRIGQAIAKRAAAFGMSIAYTARGAKPSLPYTYFPDPSALAAASDFLVVITPGGVGTRKLIDAGVLAALGAKGILVNVARGSVVDETALIDALERGVIAGAGLDVFESEPGVPQRLQALPHVVLSPHIASATVQTRQAMVDLAFANLVEHFAGRALPSPVPECVAPSL